jgi:ribosome-associated protein
VGMIEITDNIVIPENEVSFTASRSGGPGGQNVNKVSTKVTLSFDVHGSASLSEEQKGRIAGALATRINKDGILQIASQRTRSQELNRADVVERFCDLLRRALTPQRARIRTRIPGPAKRRRLEEKKKRGITKQTRSTKGWE